jgi:mitochondrial fission protein ELM1
VRELLDAMASPKQGTTRLPGRDWQVKNAAGIVEDNLIALRNMIVVQRQQAGTTKDRAKEPFMEEAQQLVSSLMGGNEERAEYHAQRLSGSAEYHAQRLSGSAEYHAQRLSRSLEDVSIGDSETPDATMAML